MSCAPPPLLRANRNTATRRSARKLGVYEKILEPLLAMFQRRCRPCFEAMTVNPVRER